MEKLRGFADGIGECIQNPMFMLGVSCCIIMFMLFAVADSISRNVAERRYRREKKKTPTLIVMDLDGTLFHWNEGADFLQPGYFENLKYFEPMRQLVDILRDDRNYEFKFCTCYPSKCAMDEKARALKRLFSNLHADEVIFVPYGDNKSDYIPYEDYDEVILIDDYTPNLKEAQEHGVKGIKAMNGINGKNGTWNGQKISVLAPATVNFQKIKRM